ncbi:phage tail tip fiber protein, partial [Salmonella enterica]|uniref:phage tail tip fiber protein n=1 Tax=Salmonella enterica TaxID=28901 RepID=UPI001EFAB176
MLKKIDLTENNASKLQQFSKEWQDANDKWSATWGVKIEQTKDGKYYVAGLGLSAYSALFDHGLASKSDQRFAYIR